jgi:predicted nuclease with TOPRIM domain
MEGDLLAKFVGAVVAIGAGLYGANRMVKRDRRDDRLSGTHDEAMLQVIETLRTEVGRLTERLSRVEEQNRLCEERNESLHLELIDLKKQLQLL